MSSLTLHNVTECLTIDQLKEWQSAADSGTKLQKAAEQAKKCEYCKRIWLKFWAELDGNRRKAIQI